MSTKKVSISMLENLIKKLVQKKLNEIASSTNTSDGQKIGHGAYGMDAGSGSGFQISGVPMMEDDLTELDGSLADQAIGQDSELVDSLFTFITRDPSLFKMSDPIRKNLMKRMLKQTYVEEVARKFWLNLVDLAVKKYQQVGGKEAIIYTKGVRVQVADKLAKDFENKVNSGEATVSSILGTGYEKPGTPLNLAQEGKVKKKKQ
jgi:hypothetical protein